MRDLVESVIDGILQQQKMQQHASNQTKQRTTMQPHPPRTNSINHASLHAIGPQQTRLPNNEKDPALWKVSVQFEAIFVQQMMSEMRQTVQKSDFIPSGFAEDVHGSMMDEAIAQASVKHHSFGIADNIYRQLEAAQSRSDKTGAKQLDNKQAESTHVISVTADTLKVNHNLALEVNKHAY